MPGYKATIIGENFEFLIDEQPQYLDFLRTIYLDAENKDAAEQTALAQVREELINQSLWNEDSEQSINLDEIKQVDILADSNMTGDFIWTFPDYIEDDED